MTGISFPTQSNLNLTRTSWIAISICTILILLQILFSSPKSPTPKSKPSNTIGTSLMKFLNDEHNHKVDFSSKKRPVVHCYYMNVDYEIALKNNANLRMWADMWSDVGWDPVILNLDDARKHPDFAKHVAEGMDVTQNAKHTRYLAMSVVPSGGWYSSIYTFPLTPILPSDKNKLPNKGKFTGHDKHVPSLLSGSQNEWIRMSHLLLQHPIEEDMLALHDLHIQDETSYAYESNVISYRALANHWRNLEVPKLCQMTEGKRAIRISPEDVVDSLGKLSFSEFARSFMSKWRTHCLADRPIS